MARSRSLPTRHRCSTCCMRRSGIRVLDGHRRRPVHSNCSSSARIKDSSCRASWSWRRSTSSASFPSQQGYRYFLIDAPGLRDTRPKAAASWLARSRRTSTTFGFDAVTAVERLDAFHRVENTYLSTFQSLGGLGLLLGTIGLAAVMFRNVLERRRELGAAACGGLRPRTCLEDDPGGSGPAARRRSRSRDLSALLAVVPAWTGGSGGGPG